MYAENLNNIIDKDIKFFDAPSHRRYFELLKIGGCAVTYLECVQKIQHHHLVYDEHILYENKKELSRRIQHSRFLVIP